MYLPSRSFPFYCLLKGKGYICVPEILCRYNFIRWQRIRLGDFGVRWKGPRSFALVGREAVWLHFNPPGLPGAVTQQEANGKLSRLNGDPPDIWSEETGRPILQFLIYSPAHKWSWLLRLIDLGADWGWSILCLHLFVTFESWDQRFHRPPGSTRRSQY